MQQKTPATRQGQNPKALSEAFKPPHVEPLRPSAQESGDRWPASENHQRRTKLGKECNYQSGTAPDCQRAKTRYAQGKDSTRPSGHRYKPIQLAYACDKACR